MNSEIALKIFILVVAVSILFLGLEQPVREEPSRAENFSGKNYSRVLEVQKCDTGAAIDLKDFKIINNMWGTSAAEQCILKYSDGSVGWNWSRSSWGKNPNYPEILAGRKPWGNSTGARNLPVKINRIQELTVSELEIETKVNGSGRWNTALEIWITGKKPEGDVSETIQEEIIIFLEQENMHYAALMEKKAVFDGCNHYSYYRYRGQNDYHQFRVESGEVPRKVNLQPFVDYVMRKEGRVEEYSDSWITGIELGNEYWGNTHGKTKITSLEYSVNGEGDSLKSGFEFLRQDLCRMPEPWGVSPGVR